MALTAKQCREHAEELRTTLEFWHSEECKCIALETAICWERLADQREELEQSKQLELSKDARGK